MKNDWEKQFGKTRRAKDKALLTECERNIQLTDSEQAIIAEMDRHQDRMRVLGDIDRESSERIARAFGRAP